MARKLVITSLILCALLITTAQPVLAAPPTQASFGFSCFGEVCRLRLDLAMGADEQGTDDAWIEFMRSSIRQAPDTLGFAIGDAITISIPNRKLDLREAELFVVTDDAGAVTHVYGSGVLPAPSDLAPDEMAEADATRIQLGYDLGSQVGAQLGQTGAQLDPQQRYWYFMLGSDLQIQSHDNQEWVIGQVPGGQFTIVIDPVMSATWFSGRVILPAPNTEQTSVTPPSETADLADAWPLHETLALDVHGQFGTDVETRLWGEASLGVSAQMAGKRFAIESIPLRVSGHASIGPDGGLIGGSIATDPVLDPILSLGLIGQFFVPFSAEGNLAASVAADVHIPLLGLDESFTQQVGAEEPLLAEYMHDTWWRVATP